MHDCRNFNHFKIKQHHLCDHIGIRIFVIKMIVF